MSINKGETIEFNNNVKITIFDATPALVNLETQIPEKPVKIQQSSCEINS